VFASANSKNCLRVCDKGSKENSNRDYTASGPLEAINKDRVLF